MGIALSALAKRTTSSLPAHQRARGLGGFWDSELSAELQGVAFGDAKGKANFIALETMIPAAAIWVREAREWNGAMAGSRSETKRSLKRTRAYIQLSSSSVSP